MLDGEWFLRYFDEKGAPVGSRMNEYGKLWLNGQSWAVLSGFAGEDGRGRTAMDAVKRHLATEKGIRLSWPGYNGFDPQKGGVTTYPPGAKENGGISCIPIPGPSWPKRYWEMATRLFLLQPHQSGREEDIADEYECEPYCYAQNILADEHPNFGLGRNAWLSGYGELDVPVIRAVYSGDSARARGLRFDPCVPGNWHGFKVTASAVV